METNLPRTAFLSDFGNARKRLLLLDFDGTLTPIVNNPADARLSPAVRTTLHRLAEVSDVVVISGRNRLFLEQTFSGLPVQLVAEHGAFSKRADQPWQQLDLSVNDWTDAVRALMTQYTDHSGSFIEEKETTLAWHYRNVTDEDIENQAGILANQLRKIASSVALTVIQGSKVVEVKPARHSKGTVALSLVEEAPYDFIVSIGDDTTDEDMFAQLPNWAYTLKVGGGTSFARYRLARQQDVDRLLQQMSEASVESTVL